MLPFIAGLLAGGIIGVFAMCFMTVAKKSDTHIEDCEYEPSQSEADDSSHSKKADGQSGCRL